MNVVEERSLRRWAYALMGLTGLSVAWIVLTSAKAVLGVDFQIGFIAKEGFRTFTELDFTYRQRLVLTAMASAPNCCWLYSMWQIMRMAMGFSRGEIFSPRTVGFLEHFGWGLVGLAISEAALLSVCGMYLVSIGKLKAILDHSTYIMESGFQICLMAALLVMIVSRILRIGIRLREDADLTI